MKTSNYAIKASALQPNETSTFSRLRFIGRPCAAALCALLLAISARGQTVTWDWQAQGQSVGDSCVLDGNLIKSTVTYPTDTNWSQSQVYGPDPCGDEVLYAPSNWSATNAPNGPSFNVLIGNMGGATPILDISVTVSNVTIQSSGALAMQSGTTLTASNVILQGDVSITGAGTIAANTLSKTAGTATSIVSPALSLSNSTVSVSSGTLELSGGSGTATLSGNSGAFLDLASGQTASWSGKLSSAGAATVRMNSGVLQGSPWLILAMTNPVLTWSGGNLGGVITNLGTISVTTPGTIAVNAGATLYNQGTVRALGSQGFALTAASSGSGAVFYNLPGATLQLGADNAVYTEGSGADSPLLINEGLLWKSTGTNTSVISVPFSNSVGSVEVDSGTLNLNGGAYAQGGGALTFKLGGSGTGQSGELICGTATLSGPLNVSLVNGFSPGAGSQFQIISATSVRGTFSSVSIPSGLTLSYQTNGVFLVSGTGPARVQILSPHYSSGDILFSFQTVNQQSYTVQYNTNLAGTNWLFYTNFTGNGSLFQFSAPVSNNLSRLFYRVREP